jgi:hypothetical protein
MDVSVIQAPTLDALRTPEAIIPSCPSWDIGRVFRRNFRESPLRHYKLI